MKLFKRKKNTGIFSHNAECIYGPPEMLEARRLKKESVYAEKNTAIDIYGPPEMLGALGYENSEPNDEEDKEK